MLLYPLLCRSANDEYRSELRWIKTAETKSPAFNAQMLRPQCLPANAKTGAQHYRPSNDLRQGTTIKKDPCAIGAEASRKETYLSPPKVSIQSNRAVITASWPLIILTERGYKVGFCFDIWGGHAIILLSQKESWPCPALFAQPQLKHNIKIRGCQIKIPTFCSW